MKFNDVSNVVKLLCNSKECDIYELCGAIGCGKTSIVKEIEEIASRVSTNVPIKFVFEDISSAECAAAINAFYEGGISSVDLEITIISSHVRNLCAAISDSVRNTVIVTDRSLIEDHLFAADLLRKEKLKGDAQSKSLVDGLEFVINSIFMLDEIIRTRHSVTRVLVDIPLADSISRISKRGRDFEKCLTEADLAPLVLNRNLCDYVLGFDENLSPMAYAVLIFTKIIGHVIANPTLVSIYGIPGIGKTFTLNALDDLVKGVNVGTVERESQPHTVYDESDSDSRKRMMADNYISGVTPQSKLQYLLDSDRLRKFLDIAQNGKRYTGRNQMTFTDIGPVTSDVFAAVNGVSPAYIHGTDCGNDIQTYREAIENLFPKRLDIVLSDTIENVRDRIAIRNRDGEDVGLAPDYLMALQDELMKIAGAIFLSYNSKLPIGKLLDVILNIVGKFLS